jgi:hypothetical protein
MTILPLRPSAEHRDHAADTRETTGVWLGVRPTDREDDIVQQLRENEHVRDVGRECLLEQLVRR